MSEEKKPFEGWAILELMGHRRLAGMLSEVEIGGHSFVRVDVPGSPTIVDMSGAGDYCATQFYSPAAIYCITPVDEKLARQVAAMSRPEPVTRWELPAPEPMPRPNEGPHDEPEEEGVRF